MLEKPMVWRYNESGALTLNDQATRNALQPDGYWIRIASVDGLWDADVRYESHLLPGAHGGRSGEGYFGQKPVVITGEVRALNLMGLRSGQRALQAAFDLQAHELRYQLWGEQEVTIALRRNLRIDMPEIQADNRFARPFVISLIADDPRSYSVAFKSHLWTEFGFATPGLRTYDVVTAPRKRDYDPPTPEERAYLGSTLIPVQQAENEGNADSHPITRIFGEVVNPQLWNVTTGEYLHWTGYTVPGGSYLEINHRDGEIRLDGTVETYEGFDFINSDFFTLIPGVNELAMTPASSLAGARVEMYWRDAYL